MDQLFRVLQRKVTLITSLPSNMELLVHQNPVIMNSRETNGPAVAFNLLLTDLNARVCFKINYFFIFISKKQPKPLCIMFHKDMNRIFIHGLIQGIGFSHISFLTMIRNCIVFIVKRNTKIYYKTNLHSFLIKCHN